jgi:DNA mismatch repair protein MutL
VRFRHQSAVHDFVRDALRQRLAETRPVSTFPVAAGAALVPRPPSESFALKAPEPLPEERRFNFSVAPAAALWAPPAAAAPAPPEPPSDEVRNPEIESLRPIGQLNDSFIIAVSAEGLWIIDQHVAHERVLFEQILRRRNGREKLEGQQLLMPYILRLNPAQQAALQEIRAELEANGFEIEPFGHSTVAVKASPAGVAAQEIEKLLHELVDNLEPVRSLAMDDVRRKVAASVACHAAIKVNMPLDHRKMEWLLRELSHAEHPMSCPHGRPVILKYAMREILKAFHRI